MIDEVELKIWLFASWRNGSIGTNDSEETDRAAFEEWYADAREIILDSLLKK